MAWLIEAFYNDEDTDFLDEGYLFKSTEGKKLEKEIREKCTELNKKYKLSFKESLKASFKQDYNKAQLNEALSFMRSKLNPFWTSDVWIQITYINGAMIKDCYIRTIGIYKNNIYNCKFHMTAKTISMIAIKEIKIDDGIIPKDVIEYTLKTLPAGISDLNITNRRIHLGAFTGKECNSIVEYCNSKHDDVVASKILGNIVFKKK